MKKAVTLQQRRIYSVYKSLENKQLKTFVFFRIIKKKTHRQSWAICSDLTAKG